MAKIRKRGANFEVDYLLDGKRKRVLLPKDKAYELFEAIERKELLAKAGINLPSEKPRYELKAAIHKYFENEVINQKVKMSQANEKRWFADFYDYLMERFVTHLDEVTPEMIKSYQTLLRKRVSASSVNRMLNPIRHFFNVCVDWEYLDANPCRRIKALKETRVRRQVWTLDQISQVLSDLPTWAREVVYFYALTGARPEEIRNITWGDVDYSRGVIRLVCGKNSVKMNREFPITEPILWQLQKLQKDCGKINNKGYVFRNSEGNQFTTDNLGKTYRRHCKLGPEYVLYGLRHTFISTLANNNVNQEIIAKLAGHIDVRTTKQYTNVNIANLGNVVEKSGVVIKLA
jgi:site-specific recombinase XerD